MVKGDRHGYVIACIPSDAELDLKALAALCGDKKAELTPLKDVQPLTGYIRGGVSPVGLKKSFQVHIDESALAFPIIAVSAGIRGCQMLLDPRDLARAVNAHTTAIRKQS